MHHCKKMNLIPSLQQKYNEEFMDQNHTRELYINMSHTCTIETTEATVTVHVYLTRRYNRLLIIIIGKQED